MAFTVYYLDDEIELCVVFSEYLARMEIDVKTFVDANEAIEHCAHTLPDLFFIDYRLKDTTGAMVAKAVSKDIPKILVTGELIAKEQHLFVDIINKPYRLKNVASVIQKYMVQD